MLRSTPNLRREKVLSRVGGMEKKVQKESSDTPARTKYGLLEFQ